MDSLLRDLVIVERVVNCIFTSKSLTFVVVVVVVGACSERGSRTIGSRAVREGEGEGVCVMGYLSQCTTDWPCR